ncbi:MAG: hypothetical protein P8179_17130 [Candidatus Thiodiazotropha sp.]|jgi:hypothetical protein
MLFSITCLILGLALIGLSIYQVMVKRRFFRAGINGMVGFLFIISATFFTLLLFNIQTYVQLTKEMPLAELEVGVTSNMGTPLILLFNGKKSIYHISSKEWRLDARFLKWQPWLSILGKEPVVRLESLSGRESRKGQSRGEVFQLYNNFQQIEELLSYLTMKFGMVDSLYGSSVYMPVKEGAKYKISATHSGLIARPINAQGDQAISNWGW